MARDVTKGEIMALIKKPKVMGFVIAVLLILVFLAFGYRLSYKKDIEKVVPSAVITK